MDGSLGPSSDVIFCWFFLPSSFGCSLVGVSGVMYSLLWQSGRGQEMLSGDHSPGETLSPCVQTGAISLQWPLTEAGSDQGGEKRR